MLKANKNFSFQKAALLFFSLILLCLLGKGAAPAARAEGDIVVSTNSGNISNTATKEIYEYLVFEMGLNDAAASGVLSNIAVESLCEPDLMVNDYYGLCMWNPNHHQYLYAFCAENGYDAATVKGQMAFLYHELQTVYPGLLAQLRSLPDNELGAWNSAYLFCVWYEKPGNADWSGRQRGSRAQYIYTLNGFDIAPEIEVVEQDELLTPTPESFLQDTALPEADTTLPTVSENAGQEPALPLFWQAENTDNSSFAALFAGEDYILPQGEKKNTKKKKTEDDEPEDDEFDPGESAASA